MPSKPVNTDGFVSSVWRQLRRRDLSANASYAFGRFETVRRLYGQARGVEQILRPPGDGLASESAAVRPFDVEAALVSLRRDAVFRPVYLSDEATRDVQRLAHTAPCVHWGDRQIFRYDDVRNGHLPNGAIAIIATVLDAEKEPCVRAVSEDPSLLSVVTKYLGYRPAHRAVKLLWSFASPATVADRHRAGQTIDYHFDVHSFNFMYVNIYLSEVTRQTGAHVMIPGSHRDKPLRWLLGPASRSDEDVLGYYGAQEMLIAGHPGEGFIQDSSCYHKALAPETADRLMLQVRYF